MEGADPQLREETGLWRTMNKPSKGENQGDQLLERGC